MEASAVSGPKVLARSPRTLRLAGDDRLVALLRAGHDAAFEVIYDRYHRPLLSFCRHMLGHPEEAADATQQTFISAYSELTRSEKPIALRAWLFTIARNRCLSMLRARRETVALEDVEPHTEGLASEVQQRADLRDLLRDLARLPEDQRAALVLAELGDLGHDEIADVLGCQHAKVKALVFQARSSLSTSREARETSCAEIREQLSVLRGGALRRAKLRRHLRECPGCREFRKEVSRQRQAMALLLPVVPAVGLKQAVLSGAGLTTAAATGAGGASMGGGAAAGAGALGAKAVAVKALVLAAIIGGGAAGGVALVDGVNHGSAQPSHSATASESSSAIGASRESGRAGLADSAAAAAALAAKPAGVHSNRAAAHRNALAHGKGHKRGLLGTQPGHNKSSSPSAGHGRSDAAPGHQGVVGGSATPYTPPGNAYGRSLNGGGSSSGLTTPSTSGTRGLGSGNSLTHRRSYQTTQ
jgi:RNA polymerase sigma factor (sigma-70 family)